MMDKIMKVNKGKAIIEKCEANNIPYIVFAANDACTIGGLIKYIDELYAAGCSAEFIADVTQILAYFKLYQYQYGCKKPD